MGFDKIWAPLRNRPVLSYSLEVLAACSEIAEIALVVSPEMEQPARTLGEKFSRQVSVCLGGVERRDSVAAGRGLLPDCDWLLVHDAARPFLTVDLILRGLQAARETGAAIAALPARDTIKRVLAGLVVETLPRDELWCVQTPQIF